MITLNGTFVIELLIYGTFYYFVKIFIWPKFCGVLEEREAFIEQGLQSAKDGYALLKDAENRAEIIVETAEAKAQKIFEEAEIQAKYIKDQAINEVEQLRLAAQKETYLEYEQMKEQFRLEARQHYVTIAEELCKKVLGDNDAAIAKSLNKLIYEL